MQNFKILCRIWKHANSAESRIAIATVPAREENDRQLCELLGLWYMIRVCWVFK